MSVEQRLSQVSPSRDTVLTIGTFDGVHRGHQWLFQCLREEAASRDLLAAAITFRNHPRTVLAHGSKVEYITPWQEREALIRAQNVELVVGLNFTHELALVRARDFAGLLVRHLRMRGLVVGPDFALGHRREGDIPTLKALGQEMGYWVWVVEPAVADDQPIRSNVLRQLIDTGGVKAAATMLGRLFSLSGKVAKGDGRGRNMGFPTANLAVEPGLLVPGDGIYATWALVNEERYQSATSIGVRPTFGAGPRAVETFIMDFDGDIYGKALTLEFVCRLREEQAFSSVSELVKQMNQDIEQARAVLTGGTR